MSARVPALALHAGDAITIATHGGLAIIRYLAAVARGVWAWLEVADDPGHLHPVRFGNDEVVERAQTARWAAA